MKKLIIILSLLSLYPFFCISQQKYTSTHKKAIKYYEEALTAYNRYNFDLSIETMHKAIKYDENFIEAYIVLAEIYLDKSEFQNAIRSYRKVIEIDPEFFPELYMPLAQIEMIESDFESAKIHLEKYLTYKHIKPKSRTQAKKKLESCLFAIETIKNPVPFNPINLGDSINTKYDEYWPSLTADEEILLITRLIPKREAPEGIKMVKNSNNYHEDFYMSVKKDGFWKDAVNAGTDLNTDDNEGAQSILVDGKTMYYTACNRKDGKGRCDIYKSEFKPNGWTKGLNLGVPVNSASWEAQPSISPDGRTLYFVSDRSEGFGGKDIWYSNLQNDGTWSKPINLGDKVNTSSDEQSPFIHPDNRTLYFASSGHVGMGGFDMFKVVRDTDGQWGAPVNLGYPINTAANEIGLIVNAKGDLALYSSDRNPENGKDIFKFELYKEARPLPVSYLKGIVYNKENKKRLEAKFELISLETKETVMQATSDINNGEFLVCLPTDNEYALNVSKEGYLFYSDNLALQGNYDISRPFIKNIELSPIKNGEKIILKNVFYETNSFELSKKSEVELDKLVEFLTLNSSLVIEVSGHTDNVGTSEYNIKLSKNRAKSVCDYIINAGISSDRISYEGYGESQPIQSNETEIGKAENRRTEVKIISSK